MEEVILRGLAGVDGRPINAELLARIIDKRILALEPALDSLDSRGFLEADPRGRGTISLSAAGRSAVRALGYVNASQRYENPPLY